MKQRFYDRVAAGVSLLLLGSLAAGTWYLAEMASRQGQAAVGGPPRHEADYFVEQFALTRLNARGEPVFRLSAERLNHFPDDDTNEFWRPTMISLDPSSPLVTLRAERGVSTTQGLETHLHDAVVLTRGATAERPEMRVETDYVLLISEEDVARTDKPVRITSGTSVLTGVGMEFNNGTRRLELKSRVQGTWAPTPDPNAKPNE